ncbi:MAG: galactitol-1-phosphate 5-dehydrogenase [Verrucomicrobiota bacterium]|nr:galactitol-1-phosphate 5-dehydrogenase [Verrucomicrobiota bacterium]
MKALTLEAYNQLNYGDAPDPEFGNTDVLIRVNACGICGSDIHGMDGSTGRRIPPIIMGHEAAGTISSIGSDVTDWQIGDRVTFDSTIYCGSCKYCSAGKVNLCENRKVLGVSPGEYRQHGAFAEYVSVPERILYKIPDNLSFEEAAFVEPVSIALHGVNRTPVKDGDTAVVIGSGMIGLLVIQALRIKGASKIIAVEIDPEKIKAALKVGADHGIISNEKTIEEIKALTEDGADIAMEVVGMSPTLNLAIESVRKGGNIGIIGNIQNKTEFPLQSVVTRELTIYGSCASECEYKESLELIANGSIKVRDMITAIAPLSEGAKWFARLYNGKEDMLKVILRPDSEIN